MIIVSTFVVLVFLYSLISHRLERTIFTAPILFTCAGVMLTLLFPVLDQWEADREAFLLVAEVGLVLTLFADATKLRRQALVSSERVPLRLLSVGMLLTILLGVVAAIAVFPGLSLWEACILAAILSPTDAGLGEVVVSSPHVPEGVRQALSVEAGLNDGLAVPFLMFFIALAQLGTEGAGQVLMRFFVEQLGFGALVGLVVGLAGGRLLDLAKQRGWMAESLQQLGLVALPILCVLGVEPVGGSMFIAAFVAGIAVQVGFRDAGKESVAFSEGWGRLLDYFVFFLFGMLFARALPQFYPLLAVYALLSLTVVRMLPVAISLWGTHLNAATVLFMGWFGPRGLASIVLGLVYLEQESHLPGEATIKLAVMMTVLLSILAHGFSALPGISVYSRRVAALSAKAPEHRPVLDEEP